MYYNMHRYIYKVEFIFITDNVLTIIELVSNSYMYSEPTSTINNIVMLREIVKKCGFKSNLTSNPHLNKKQSDEHLKDAFKR